MKLIDAAEAARRVQAAAAYSGLEQSEIATRSGISIHTLRRIVKLSEPRGASVEELWALADACNVPRWFMEDGFARPAVELEERIEQLEATVSQLAEDAVRSTGRLAFAGAEGEFPELPPEVGGSTDQDEREAGSG